MLLIGPNAEDIEDPLDTATTAEGLSFVLSRAARTWPAVSVRSNITNFSGVRAHLEMDDFLIGPVSGAQDAFEAIGIESPIRIRKESCSSFATGCISVPSQPQP